MPLNSALALRTWERYAYCRDNGHQQFVEKADKCERFFRGDQWDSADLTALRAQRRPALTINKIISTISTVMGEQIYNRSEIAFRPRGGSPSSIADILTKVFKQISDNNQLDWLRSDMFADGIITSRGFLDVRIDFSDSLQGEVRITGLNPKNVVIDPDAEHADPDTWNEVFVTKWLTADDIAILYNEEDAAILRERAKGNIPFGYDSIDNLRDRVGSQSNYYVGNHDETSVTRNIRVIERQYRTLDKQIHFLAPETGDTRPVPEDFDRNRIAWFKEKFGFEVIQKLAHRIKWCVVADDIVLHEEWSPYKHLTVIPYFPYFRHGQTVGLVENLLGPQELLNKVSSQELHVINTTANSGWIVTKGAVKNMSVEELEQRGAETGLVIEVDGEPTKAISKIQPNQIPTGLERVSFKTEEHIKTISGVSDSMQGFDREDVAAKAIQTKRQAGSTNLAKPMDSLTRSDFILARNTLDLVQEFYSEPRILTITKDRVTGDTEDVRINQVDETGQVLNDLTLGEYGVVVSSVPQRETLEDSQFEQAVALKELGIDIPDEVLLQASRLMDKQAVIKMIADRAQTPEAQARAEAATRIATAEADKAEGEAREKHSKADLNAVKAQKEAQPEQGDGGAGVAVAHAKIEETRAKIGLEREKFAHEQQLDYMRLDMEREENAVDAAIEQRESDERMANERARVAIEASRPQPTTNETTEEGTQ